MPYIKVNTSKIQSYNTETEAIRSRVASIRNDFASVVSCLDWDVKSKSSISQKADRASNELATEAQSLYRMNSFLQNAVQKYVEEDSYSQIQSDQLETEPGSIITDQELSDSFDELSEVTGVPSEQLKNGLDSGQFKLADVLECINKWVGIGDKAISGTNSFIKFVSGFGKLNINITNGKVILSNFTRSGILNKLTKLFSKNKAGLGTNYRWDTFQKTLPGKLYKLGKVADAIGKVANVVEAGVGAITGALDAAGKINNIWADDTKSLHDKTCETKAVYITSTAGIALDVAAPFVGTAVAAAIPIPVVGAVVGIATTKAMQFASDVITSEEVVGAVAAGTKAVSNAKKQLLESDNFGEAITNTANLVGETFKASAEVVSAVVNTAVNKAVEGISNTVNNVKNFFKKW